MVGGALVIDIYYTRKAYNLTFRFENNPGGAELPEGQTDIKHGTVVYLENVDVPKGYTFDGWYNGTTKVGDSLTMPASDTEVTGKFIANTDVQYTVEYYLQNIDGTDYEKSDKSYTRYGTTGEYVAADTKTFTGFSFNAKAEGTKWNGHVEGAGTLVLKLYYDRNSYTVNYYYLGNPPANTHIYLDGNPFSSYSETVRYGTPMTVKSALTANDDAYEFRGWYSANLPGVAATAENEPGDAYTMPAHNVEFRGALYNYTVYYDLNGGTLDGSDTVLPKKVDWDDAGLLPADNPEKGGMIFSGWSHDSKKPSFVSASDKYSDLAGLPYIEAIILTAEYADGYRVSYDWGTQNIPQGVTIPNDETLYANGEAYAVDSEYTDSFKIQTKDEYGNVNGEYTFSGWTDPFNGRIDGENVNITGSWTYTPVEVDTWDVVYVWSNPPSGVELPAPELNVVNGASHKVDTTYTASTVVSDTSGNARRVWTFTGWDNSGTITVTSDVTISGVWHYGQIDIPATGSAILTKVDANDNSKVIPGVVFELYGEDGILRSVYTTGNDGKIYAHDLDVGNYYWVEICSAEGYVLDSDKHAFTVTKDNITYVMIENAKTEVPNIFIDDHYAYIIGRDDGLVHPEANITRAEIATIFFRLLGEDTRNRYMTRYNSFTDVNEEDWYNNAISTMAAMGIVNGRPDNTFDPNANITRAEFAAIAARFEEHGNTSDASFLDIYDHWAKKEINIAANNGWVLGYEDGSFKPDQLITRAEAMTMVNRVMQRIPESPEDLLEDMILWPDNMDTEKWYYLMVQEATNSHYYVRKGSGYESWTDLREVPDLTAFEKTITED